MEIELTLGDRIAEHAGSTLVEYCGCVYRAEKILTGESPRGIVHLDGRESDPAYNGVNWITF